MAIPDRISEGIKKGKELVKKGKEIAIREAEKAMKIERLKMDIQDLKKQKEHKMKIISNRVFELYTKNQITDSDLLSLCQDIKTVQWQIDEKWGEINSVKGK